MKYQSETLRLAQEIRSELRALPSTDTASVRNMRRKFSLRIKSEAPERVVELALHLLDDGSGILRFVAYELLSHHKEAFDQLTVDDLLPLGEGLDSWSSVDCYAMYLSGPKWARRDIPDKIVVGWAGSHDLWWRRVALVSTVPLSRRGDVDDILKVERICALLAGDREDMVVKALSWALRELGKKHPANASNFLARHRDVLAARVVREVTNKLTTGLKTPRGRGGNRGAVTAT